MTTTPPGSCKIKSIMSTVLFTLASLVFNTERSQIY